MSVRRWLHNPEVNGSQEISDKPHKGSIRNFILRVLDRKNSLESVLRDAKAKWDLVEEIASWEYQVSQKQDMKWEKLSHIDYSSADYYVKTVSSYKKDSPEPTKPFEETKYYYDKYFGFGEDSLDPVIKKIIRNADGIKYYIFDQLTGLGVEFSWYDEKWNKIPGQEPMVCILWKDRKIIKTYTWEDIENALLVPALNETDKYSRRLLDIKRVLSNHSFSGRVLDWQADSWTESLVKAWKKFNPENFISIKELDNTQEYVDFVTNTAAFIENLPNYNEFAKLRNLSIEESMENWKQVLRFKNSKDYVVREIIADSKKWWIKSDTFFQLTVDGDVYQSATRNGKGEIVSRSIVEFRSTFFWVWKERTVTLDYEHKKAKSWLYVNWELTNTHEMDIIYWEEEFGFIASRPIGKEIEK